MTDSWLVRRLIVARPFGVGALAGIVVRVVAAARLCVSAGGRTRRVFPFLYYVTHTSVRYRHPIDPEVLLLTAIACGAGFGVMPASVKIGPDRGYHFADAAIILYTGPANCRAFFSALSRFSPKQFGNPDLGTNGMLSVVDL